MKYLSILLILSALLLTSCAEISKKKVSLVSPMATPAKANSSLPFLFSDGRKLSMSWVEKVGDSLNKLFCATFQEDQWGPPEEIISGNDWFVNWADFPAITENKGNLLTHVLKKSSTGTYSYDVKLNVRQQGGKQWETDLALHNDNTPTEHGFVTMLPYGDGFFITWLDGRNTVENTAGERGAMTIRAAEVAFDGTVTHTTELDYRTCDCCQTTAAITDNGPVVIYRDRTEEEVRDISIVRRVAGVWSDPKSIYADGWNIKGCPVNGPKAAVLGNHLAIAWFTAANDAPLVNLIFSKDGGATFDAPIRIDKANAMGRVDVLLLEKDEVVVSWMEAGDGQALIKAVRVHRDGNKGKVMIISELDASRKTGFPQMELVGDTVYFAWTDVIDDTSQLHIASVLAKDF